MNKKRRVLSFLMALVMVLGVMAVLPITVSASVTLSSPDLRYMYQFIQANDTASEYTAVLDDYKSVGYVSYVEGASPVVDGTIGDAEYTVSKTLNTKSFVTDETSMQNKAYTYASSIETTEYFAQDEDYIYIAFEMPYYTEAAVNLYLGVANPGYSISSNNNLLHNYNSRHFKLTTGADGTTTAGTDGGWSGSNAKITHLTSDYLEDLVSLKKPTGDDTSAYVEYKIKKSDIETVYSKAAGSLSIITYGFSYCSKDGESAQQLNYISNQLKHSSTLAANVKAAGVGSYETYKHIPRCFYIADYRYDTEGSTNTLTSLTKTAPVADGTIDVIANEYTLASTATNGVKEYFAIDEQYLYMAFDFGNALEAGKTLYLTLYTSNDGTTNGFAGGASQNTSSIVENGISDLGHGWVAGGEQKTCPSQTQGTWSGSVTGKVNSTTGVVEVKIKLIQLFKATNKKSTTTALYASYPSFADMDNLRYSLNYVKSGETAATYHAATPTAHDSAIFGSKETNPRNINFNLKELFKDVDVRDLSAFGYESMNVGFSNKALDVTDGVIDPADYTATRSVSAGLLQTSTTATHVTEYMAHDDEYIYMAYTIKNHDINHANGTQIKIWYTDSALAADSGEYCQTRFNFMSANAVDGVIPAKVHDFLVGTTGEGTAFSILPANTSNFTADDYSGTLRYDTDGTTGILEFKISKASLARGSSRNEETKIDVIDFSNFRMELNYRADGGNNDGWHTGICNYTNGSNHALFGALDVVETAAGYTGINPLSGGALVGRSYNFLYTDVESADLGSIRFGNYGDTAGLRFQTTVTKQFIEEKRAEGYDIEVGTLIAPANTLIGDLRHVENGVENKKYIDVKATLNNPYNDGVTTVTFTGSIVNINPWNIARDFTAVGYVKLTKGENVEYIYSNAVTKNVKAIAQAALDSGKYAEATDEYNYLYETANYVYTPAN